MSRIVAFVPSRKPALVAAAGDQATIRFLEFSSRRSATRPPAEPMPAPSVNFLGRSHVSGGYSIGAVKRCTSVVKSMSIKARLGQPTFFHPEERSLNIPGDAP